MKKLITLLLAAALMSQVVAFAETISYKDREFVKEELSQETLEWLEEYNAMSSEEQEAIDYAPAELLARGGAESEEIEEEVQTGTPVFENSMYIDVTAGSAKVSKTEDGLEMIEAVDMTDQDVIVTIGEDTLIVDANGNKAEVTDGAEFTAYIVWSKPMVMSLPPRYDADVIVVKSEEDAMMVDVNAYVKDGEGYLNTAGNLFIFAGESEIVDREGAEYKGELDGKDLAVFYDISTRSIPAQTNPKKIIVLGDSAELPVITPDEEVAPEADEKAEKIAVGDKTFEIVEKLDTDMVAVRAVAEALELEVAWDNDLKRVTIGTTAMGVNFQVGENSYNKSKMTPFVLEAAPVLEQTEAGGVTYLPVSFFTEVLGCTAEIAGGVMTLTLA